MPRITTFLTYNDKAEEAAGFYVSVFENSRLGKVTRYGDAGPGPKGSVLTVEFQLDGQHFVACNGGPHFKFTDGVSLSVECETQREIDAYWERLSEGGEEGPCGWVKDKFGLWWQVNPIVLGKMLGDGDLTRADRVMRAMLDMKKLDIEALKQAYAGE